MDRPLSDQIIDDPRSDFPVGTIHKGWVKDFVKESRELLEQFGDEKVLEEFDKLAGEELLK